MRPAAGRPVRAQRPGAPPGEPPIRLGTSGWRGVLGEEFTLPRLRAALRGAAAWFAERGGGRVIVAHDTRFLADRMAGQAALALAEAGLEPVLGRGATPTPVVARTVRRRRAAGALVLTASHNPPEYAGLKVMGPEGGCIGDADAKVLERAIAAADRGELPGRPPRASDLNRAYRGELLRRLDREAIGRARPAIAYDAMHGAGAGVLDDVLTRAGARVQVLHADPDPRFGGHSPDPRPERLRALRELVRGGRGLRLGLASDGDADRFAVVDADGRVLSETDALALLVDHLASSGRIRGGVALSVATGSLVERVAERHGLAVSRHPIGFKHLTRVLAGGAAEVAGEESGGFAWGRFGRDKDGLLAGALLTERLAQARRPLGEALARLHRELGRSDCGRLALPATPSARDALARLLERPPDRVGGVEVREAQTTGALRLAFDDGFLMLRGSGTEPVLRVYAEARGPRALARRLAAGRALLGLAGASRRSG
jgi:phosphoglucomutase